MNADLTTPATLEGRVALVTGGGSGIGQATVRLLAARGASVMVADIDGSAAEATAESLQPDQPNAAVQVDVTSSDGVAAMVEAAIDRFGGIDIAVNAAGISGEYLNTAGRTDAEWQRMIDVNLTGVFLCLRAELAKMAGARRSGDAERVSGAIVNVASGAGEMGVPGLAHYSAAKHGVVGLTKSAALEYARKGIRINAVLPGPIRTPMLQGFAGGDEGVDSMGKMMPVGRAGEPEEVAQAIAWLCSDQASYITGHMLAVDGGASAA